MGLIENLVLTSITILLYIIGGRLLVEFILSLNRSPYNHDVFFFKYLFKITEPFALPFRKILPPALIIDISLLLAIVALETLQILIARLFAQYNLFLQIT
jgi:YggT family protein